MNRIDQAIRDAEGAVTRVTGKAPHAPHAPIAAPTPMAIRAAMAIKAEFVPSRSLPAIAEIIDREVYAEIDKLREDKQTCVLMLRALYTWLDGIGDGAPDASPTQKEALWRCATITETLEKVGEL